MLPLLLSAAALAAPECKTTQTLTATSGTIQITGESYRGNLSQCWQLKAECPAGTRLRLHFSAVDVESGYDFVQVWSGEKALSDDVESGDTFYSDGALTVAFTTDKDITREGFTAAWSCEGEDAAYLDEYLSAEDVEALAAADVETQHSALSALLSEIEAEGLAVSTEDGVVLGEACGLVTGELEDLSWEDFAEKSREAVERCDSALWTDLNIHDPGVALLELLIHGLSELSRLSSLPLEEEQETPKEEEEGTEEIKP